MADTTSEKAVIVLDGTLPVGLLANAAAVLGVSVGSTRPDLIGRALVDASGTLHPGIISVPLPVLSGSGMFLVDLKHAAANASIHVAEFTDVAQRSRSYSAYAQNFAVTKTHDIRPIGLVLLGPRTAIDRLVGNLKTLR